MKGAVKRTRTGFQVEVPVQRGAKRRVRRTLSTKSEAHAWLKQVRAAHDAGLPTPQPGAVPASVPEVAAVTAPAPASAGTAAESPEPQAPSAGDEVPAGRVRPVKGFEPTAEAWMREYFGKMGRGKAERRCDVEAVIANHLVPFMKRNRFATGSDVTREAYVDFLVSLVNGETPSANGGVGSGDAVSVEKAIELTGASRSTIRRRLRASALPGSCRVGGKWMIPLRALANDGLLTGVALRRGPRVIGSGYNQRSVADIRRIFDAILAHGCDTSGWTLNFVPGTVANPLGKRATRKRVKLTVGECVAMAEHMHPVSQTALWLIRVLGVRISEAHGIRLGDIVDDGVRGVVRLHAQGGRGFLVDDSDGQTRTVGDKDELKTVQSYRVLVIPQQLMHLLRVVIHVFHTDAHGTVNDDARLIPPMTTGLDSQSSFRSALRNAAIAAGVTLGQDPDTLEPLLPRPHDGRAGLVTDLAWDDVDEVARKRWAGHRVGDDVHSRHYVLDDPSLCGPARVAEALEAVLEAEAPDGLLVPTTVSCTTGRQPLLQVRKEHIDRELLDIGWTRVAQDDQDRSVLTAAQTATTLRQSMTTIHRWRRAGRFGATTRNAAGHHLFPVADVLRVQDELASQRGLATLALEWDVPYERLHWYIRRDQLMVEKREDGALLVPAETEQALSVIVRAYRDLEGRAMTIGDAAVELQRAPLAVEGLIRDGVLELDPMVGPNNARYVTRASIEAYPQWAGSRR